MKRLGIILLMSLFIIAGTGISEAHKKRPPRPQTPAIKVARKEDQSFLSVLKGFLGRIPPQNKKADGFELEQIQDEDELENFIKAKVLALVPGEGRGFIVELGKEPARHQYARDYLLKFILDWGKFYDRELGAKLEHKLKISSLVRPVNYQQAEIVGKKKSTANCNIADHCTLHSRGNTVDISKLIFRLEKGRWIKKQMSLKEEQWMRRKLAELHRADIGVDVTEEIRLNHFHIIVFPNYRGLPAL